MAKHNIHSVKPIFSIKLAGMQTLDSFRAKNKILWAYKLHALCYIMNILHNMPQIHVKYLTFIKITNLATEGALSLIVFFFLSQTVTNSHIAACWNFLSLKREKRRQCYIFSFCVVKRPPPKKNKTKKQNKNSLSQRSRLLRIQHWDVIFTYKQNKHLAATDSGRIRDGWCTIITWGQAGPHG